MVFKIIDKAENFIFKSNPYFLFFGLLIIMILKSGIWYIPNMPSFEIVAKNPFVNPHADAPLAHYVVYNWLSAFLVYISPLKGLKGYFIFHFVAAFLFTFIFFINTKNILSDRNSRISIIIFFLIPVSGIGFFWVGLDGLNLLLMLMLLVCRNQSFLLLFFAALLGMQHFEQGFIAIAALWLSFVLSMFLNKECPYSLKFCIIVLSGVVLGKLLLELIFYYKNLQLNSGRIFWLSKYYKAAFLDYVLYFNFIFWGSLGLGWFVFIKYVEFQKEKWLVFGLSLLLLILVIPIIARDQTRAIAAVTFLLIGFYWLINEKFLSVFSKKEVTYMFLLWLVLPWGFVLGGRPQPSLLVYDAVYGINIISEKTHNDYRINLKPYN